MGATLGTRRIGIALLVGAVLFVGGVGLAGAEQAKPDEETVPSWVNWLNDRLPFGLNVTGLDIEAGGRVVGGDTNAAKFEEYRVIDENPFLDHARISLETKDKKRYIEVFTENTFKGDQSFLLRAGKYGGYDLEVFWDQIPHRLSTTARTLFTTTQTDSTASLTLPPGAASAVQAAPAANRPSVLAGFLADASPVTLQFLTSKGGFGFKYPLTDSLDLGLRYTFTQKEGTIPFATGFGSPGGNIVELPAPLFNRTHLVEAKAQFARPGWNIGFGYAASIFDQGIDNVSFDNPLQATDTATLSARGRSTFDPSNSAHNVFLMGGLSLPLRTRITGKVSYGWRLQDDPFVAHTINPLIGSNPLLALPQGSLDGDIRTVLVTLNATSRPFAFPLTLYGGYRYYELDNRTPEVELPAHVVRDQAAAVVDERVNAPYSYSKHNAHLDAGYALLRNLHLKVGYEWERWDRNPDHREVPTSDEHFLKGSLDYTPIDMALLRLSYRRGWRSIDEYNTQAHHAHVVLDIEEGSPAETLEAQGQSVLLRKFDESDRIRDRVEFLASVTPIEAVNVTATFSLLQDDFDESPLGLQFSRGWSAGGDLVYSPFSWLSLFVNYMREELFYDQLSRSRPVISLGTPPAPIASGCVPGSSANTVVCDFPDFNWRSKNRDTVDTYGVGADISLIPDRLNLRLTYSFSEGDTEINSFNTPTSGQPVGTGGSPAPAAQRTTATAFDFPLVNTNLHTLLASLRYKLTKNWSVKAEYRWEQFNETDWQTDLLGLQGNVNRAPTTDVFLGARFLQDYNAHIGSFTVRYLF